MPAQWTGTLIGDMHLAGVTAKQLAVEVGWHEKYLSAVINGHREPKGAEEKLREALDTLIEKRNHMLELGIDAEDADALLEIYARHQQKNQQKMFVSKGDHKIERINTD